MEAFNAALKPLLATSAAAAGSSAASGVMECPCPKAFTGPHGWGPNKHWMVRDIVIRCVSGVCVSGVYVLAVRFKSIKQDRRIA